MFKSAADPAVQRINVTEMYEVLAWADRCGCTPRELKDAISAVGNIASDVRKHLACPKPTPGGRAALEAAFRPRDEER